MSEMPAIHVHREVELLLPWFVNNTLDVSERHRVEGHLRACAECQDTLSALTNMQNAISTNAPVPIVPRPRVGDLLNSINDRKVSTRAQPQWPGLSIAASAITASIVALLFIVNDKPADNMPARFETASSERSIALMEFVMNIEFEESAGQMERQQLLQEMDATVQSIMNSDNEVRVLVRLRASSLEEIEMHTRQIESSPAVRSVEILALQLPVRQPR